jgi:hypothetical protein
MIDMSSRLLGGNAGKGHRLFFTIQVETITEGDGS